MEGVAVVVGGWTEGEHLGDCVGEVFENEWMDRWRIVLGLDCHLLSPSIRDNRTRRSLVVADCLQ